MEVSVPKTDCVWDCLADEVVLCVFHALLSSPGQAVPNKVPSCLGCSPGQAEGEAVCAGDNELRALCSVSATCRRWAALARDDGLWRRLLFLHRGQPLAAPVEGLDAQAGPPPPLAWLGRCLQLSRWPASPARSVQARVSGLVGLVEFTVGRVHTPLDGPPQAELWLYRWPKYRGASVDDEWRRTQSSIACPEPFANWKACYAWHAGWLDRELAHLWEGRPPNMRCLVLLCLMAQEVFNREPNVLRLSSPITVAAGPRGQFVDLIKLMRLVLAGKEPPAAKYLFLGGYTERGGTGLQCFLLLLALKVKYPDHVYLLRGGKDNASMSRIYGLYDECKRIYGGVQSWKLLVSTFQCLPLAAVIDDRTFCVHHGMSPTLHTLQDMDALPRNELAEDEAPLCDLLFSEPQDSPWWAPNEDLLGYLWGPDVTEWWNRNNGFEFLVRSGGYIAEGYEKKHGGRVISLCSAPDWCGTLKNPGAVLLIDRSSMRILLFEAASDRMRSLPLRSEDLHLAVSHGEALPADLHCAELSPLAKSN